MLDGCKWSGSAWAAISTRTEKPFGNVDSRDPAHTAASESCDLCGAARARSERGRLVWDSGLGNELVLADLCRRCAGAPDELLEIYGTRSHGALRVTPADPVSGRDAAAGHSIRGVVLRGLAYVVVALAAFVVITIVTSRG